MTDQEIRARYPRLIWCLMWAACLSEGEASACIRDYRAGLAYSGEAVNHYGGTKAALRRASRARVRHVYASFQRWQQAPKPASAQYRSLGD